MDYLSRLRCVYGATKFRPSRTYNHISGDSLERQQICGNWCNNKSSHGQYFCYVWSSILRCRSKRQNGQIFLDVFSKNKKSVRYDTKSILEYSYAGYNVFDAKPPSKSDGLVTIERPLFTQLGALSPYTINKTDDENDQDNWVQVC